jgi:hypothetical protein
MWISLFVITIVIAVCVSVAAIMLRDRDTMGLPLRTSIKTKPAEPDLETLLVGPEVRLMMRSDHVDKRKLLVDLKAISVSSVPRNKNATSILTFDKAVQRLHNMSDMMGRLGFDAETLARTKLDVNSVFHACQNCLADEVCHDWLARAPKSIKGAPVFCPNAECFARTGQVAA